MRFDGPFIMGTGLVTALGDGVEPTWRALLAGESIGTHSPAQVETDGRLPRVTQLALRAAREAIGQANWKGDALVDDRTALLVGTSRGPIHQWIEGGSPPPAMGIHATARDVAEELSIGQGPKMTFSAACASSLHALIRACMMLRAGEVDRAIVIGAEASLHPLFLACFQRLGVLARQGNGCRPFDVDREGFLVSEAAAAVCLETSPTQPGAWAGRAVHDRVGRRNHHLVGPIRARSCAPCCGASPAASRSISSTLTARVRPRTTLSNYWPSRKAARPPAPGQSSIRTRPGSATAWARQD